MSEVILDTITGKSTATTITIGSTPVVSSSANSMTIRGEGTAQTSIQQGLAKAWVNLDGSGTISALASFNISSVSDTDTGSYVFNISSVLSGADANCVQVTSIKGGGAPSGTNYTVGYTDEAANTSRFGLLTVGDGGASGPSGVDRDHVYGTLHGDLA